MSDQPRRLASCEYSTPSAPREQSDGTTRSQARPAGRALDSTRSETAHEGGRSGSNETTLGGILKDLLRSVPTVPAPSLTASSSAVRADVAGIYPLLDGPTTTSIPRDEPGRDATGTTDVTAGNRDGGIELLSPALAAAEHLAGAPDEQGLCEQPGQRLLSSLEIDQFQLSDPLARTASERSIDVPHDSNRRTEAVDHRFADLPVNRIGQRLPSPALGRPSDAPGPFGTLDAPTPSSTTGFAIPIDGGDPTIQLPDSIHWGGEQAQQEWTAPSQGRESGTEGHPTSIPLRGPMAFSGPGFESNSFDADRSASADGRAYDAGFTDSGGALGLSGQGQAGQDGSRTNAILGQILDEIRRLAQPPLIASARAVYPER